MKHFNSHTQETCDGCGLEFNKKDLTSNCGDRLCISCASESNMELDDDFHEMDALDYLA